MFFDLKEAQYLEDYKIALRFEDGSAGEVDLSGYPDKDTVFRAFLDMDFFRELRVECGVLVWGDGELDIAPETLYAMATGRTVSYEKSSDQTVYHISPGGALERAVRPDSGGGCRSVSGVLGAAGQPQRHVVLELLRMRAQLASCDGLMYVLFLGIVHV
ncbi:MAG: DUF2442 domain-containing protein [Candidatus Eisenbacteria bacterium]|nr:DUF2442 domain-containing protein [Candidatus Eisenbacteria bacterium]